MTTAKALVENALYLSLYDEAFQPAIETGMVTSALTQFNLMLDEFRDKIPYTFQYEFTNVDDLENTAFVTIDDVAYVINGVVFEMIAQNLIRFRETATIENLIGFPAVYFFDESTQSIEVYPKPNNPEYKFIVNGRKSLGPLAMNDALPANMTLFMQNALTYELAFRIAGKFGAQWNEMKESTRQQLMKGLMEKQVVDLTPIADILFPNADGQAYPFPWFFYASGGGR